MILIIPFLSVCDAILDFVRYLLFAYIILGWLEAFNIVNRHNQVVSMISMFLFRVLEPILGRIRRILPDLGMIDLSPFVLLLAIMFLRNMIVQIIFQYGR